MPHNGHTWGDICGADIGGVCRWGSWAVACKAGGVCRKGCVCRKGPWYSPLPLYTCNQKGQQHYHSLIPDADMDVITELRQSKELSGIQHTPKPNPNPTPFHNLYSIECAVNMRTWRKMNSEVDTCTAWVPVDRKKKALVLGNSLAINASVKCCLSPEYYFISVRMTFVSLFYILRVTIKSLNQQSANALHWTSGHSSSHHSQSEATLRTLDVCPCLKSPQTWSVSPAGSRRECGEVSLTAECLRVRSSGRGRLWVGLWGRVRQQRGGKTWG